jgi:ABC-type uncharacterized transport system substrate-binding protein
LQHGIIGIVGQELPGKGGCCLVELLRLRLVAEPCQGGGCLQRDLGQSRLQMAITGPCCGGGRECRMSISIVVDCRFGVAMAGMRPGDPLKAGFVDSLAKPGGNVTGFAEFEDKMGTKWLQLLREVAPNVTRVIFLHSANPPALIQLPALQDAAASIGVQVISARASIAADIEQTFAPYAREPGLGLIVGPSAFLAVHRNRIIALAAEHRIPAVYYNRRYPASGGLLSYGADRIEQYRRAASYADRILRGEKPGDLPVQKMEKFEFVLNMKTATSLGLHVPRIILLRADEVIE